MNSKTPPGATTTMQITIHMVDLTHILQPGSILSWLLMGLIAGYLGSSFVRGRGFGCLGNTIVGLIGAVIGGILASALEMGHFAFCGSVFISFIGAVIFVSLLQLFTGGRS
jgi:uncharacterized membrane protein YeaQ/YmgE (transglycosylase-associated protein family)